MSTNAERTELRDPQLTVILTEQLMARLREVADGEDRSMGAVVRQALRDYFEKAS